MEERSLKKRIMQIKEAEDELIALLNSFKPLLIKYAMKLKYEDAYYDLQSDLIEIILNLQSDDFSNDFCVLTYINKSIYHAYVKRSKKYQRDKYHISFYNEYDDQQLHHIEVYSTTYDDYFYEEFFMFKNTLTYSEFQIIYKLFCLDYSVREIAQEDNLSKQAVYRLKNKALHKLKEHYQL